MGEKKKKIAAPVTEGVVKVPVIMQLEALECGAACLTMIMAYYSKWIPLEQVRLDCGVSRDGSKARNILRAARQYGMDVEAFRQTPESLKKDGKYPCIIHWNMNHFVVLNGFKGDKYAVLNDPARGTVKVPMEEFNKSFTGVVLIPTPSEDFEPGGKKKSTWDYAKERLKGSQSAMVFLILTSVILYLFGIIKSVTSKIFMDRLLTGKDLNWLTPFLLLPAAGRRYPGTAFAEFHDFLNAGEDLCPADSEHHYDGVLPGADAETKPAADAGGYQLLRTERADVPADFQTQG